MAQRRREICRADTEELLSRIEMISVLCREGAARRDAFDVGEQQTTGGKRYNSLYITKPKRGTFQAGQAGRNASHNGYTERGEAKQGSRNDRQCNNAKRDRFSRQHPFAERQ